MSILLRFVVLFSLLSCSGVEVEDYQDATPRLDFRTFFTGKLKAHGFVKNRSGKVTQKFVVDMVGTWKDKRLTLDEKFYYSDGSKSTRIWTFDEKGQSEYIGRAGDVIGDGYAKLVGDTFYLEYVLEVKIDGSTYHINVVDWMHLIDDKTLMAKSDLTKFGFNVGEVILVMKKL